MNVNPQGSDAFFHFQDLGSKPAQGPGRSSGKLTQRVSFTSNVDKNAIAGKKIDGGELSKRDRFINQFSLTHIVYTDSSGSHYKINANSLAKRLGVDKKDIALFMQGGKITAEGMKRLLKTTADKLYVNKDYERAAELGNVPSMLHLAQNSPPEEAIKMYLKAAHAGDASAKLALGKQLIKTKEELEGKRALDYFNDVVKHKSPDHDNIYYVDKDSVIKAEQLIKEINAAYNSGKIGSGVNEVLENAAKWGHKEAQYELGKQYLEVNKLYEAEKYLQMAVNQEAKQEGVVRPTEAEKLLAEVQQKKGAVGDMGKNV